MWECSFLSCCCKVRIWVLELYKKVFCWARQNITVYKSAMSLTHFSSLSFCLGHGPFQHALSAPHGGMWGLLHCSPHPAVNLRCLLEVKNTYTNINWLMPHSCLYVHIFVHNGNFIDMVVQIQKWLMLAAASKSQWGLIRNKLVWF